MDDFGIFIEKMNEDEKEYYTSLNENEKKIIELAYNHLESSFDISKSIGYLKFTEKKTSGKVSLSC